MKSLLNERGTVQAPIIKYAVEVGWSYLPPEEALRLRGGEDQPVLRRLLVEQLQRLNPGVVTTATKAEEVVDRLVRVRPDIEGNREAWEYLRGLKTVFIESERRERNVRLIDPVNPDNNMFHVTDEFVFQSGQRRIRADIVFFVNGVPVILVETKSATRMEGISEAFEQVKRYHRDAPELTAQTQLFALTHLIQFFYGVTWSLSLRTLFNWRDDMVTESDFESLVKTFVAPRRVLRVISDYILFVRKDGELSKAVLRPHQMRAVERVLSRARDPEKRRGLVWHTQGSGKTYTMIVAAKRLLEDPSYQNPTVLMIVDRNELQQQLFQNLESVGFGRVHVARSKRHLQDLLARDTRGLIVSMIHKFDDIPANLNTRQNIFVLVDEAHRSTGGDLGNYLLGALPNATFIGFTGTPIDKTAYGKGTFKTFGTDDPKGYLDKYSIRESIADGTTVRLNYSLAPNDLRVDPETLEREFLNLKEIEGVSDIEVLNRILDRAVNLKNMLKSPRRVDSIARYVAKDFNERVKPMGYKAFLVAVDREACCLYKEALDRYLPKESSAVVISRGQNDPEHIRRYHLSDDEEERIRKAFRKPGENPEILIVTEKLLTGYDAPILYCMYLDKPMRDHVLLQAIARVNRPYEDENGRRKPAGLVIDFVGIFDKLERALAFDSEDVQGVIHGIDALQVYFKRLMHDGQTRYLELIKGSAGDKAVELLLEHFREPEKRKEYYSFFRELQDVYEILSPDPFLRPFMDDYAKLSQIYMLLRACYDARPLESKELLHKTEKLVQEHTYPGCIRPPEVIYAIDATELDRIATSKDPDIKKVFNLLMAIQKVAEESRSKPYLVSIAERAREIANRFEQRQITTQEALQELIEGPVREMQEAEEELRKRDLDPRTFSIFWTLHREGIEDADTRARSIASALDQYPHWAFSEHQGRELRKLITKILLDALGVDRVSDAVERLLNVLRREAS